MARLAIQLVWKLLKKYTKVIIDFLNCNKRKADFRISSNKWFHGCIIRTILNVCRNNRKIKSFNRLTTVRIKIILNWTKITKLKFN